MRIYLPNSTTTYTELIYNSQGLLTSEYDPERRRVDYTYDPATGDRLAELAYTDAPTYAVADVTRMQYNAYGQVRGSYDHLRAQRRAHKAELRAAHAEGRVEGANTHTTVVKDRL